MELLADATILPILEAHPYVAAFVAMVLCGVIPFLPEELVLVLIGYTAWAGHARLDLLVGCAIGGVLVGDLGIYAVGRSLGTRLTETRAFRLLVRPRNLRYAREKVRRHGPLAVILVRPLYVVRGATYFVAGTMKLPVRTFVLWNLLGTAVMIPLMAGAGYAFGAQIDAGLAFVQTTGRVAALVVGVVILGVVASHVWPLLGSDEEVEEECGEETPPPPSPPADAEASAGSMADEK